MKIEHVKGGNTLTVTDGLVGDLIKIEIGNSSMWLSQDQAKQLSKHLSGITKSEINWKELNESFINECTVKVYGETKHVFKPQKMFEWFKKEVNEWLN